MTFQDAPSVSPDDLPEGLTVGPMTRRDPEPFDGPRWHRISVETVEPGSRQALRQSTEGGDAVTAAWLRAYADQIDPPKPPRPNLREDGGGRRGPIIQERRVPGQVAALPPVSDVPGRSAPGWAPLSGQ